MQVTTNWRFALACAVFGPAAAPSPNTHPVALAIVMACSALIFLGLWVQLRARAGR